MGRSNQLTSSLDIVKEICDDLGEFFEAFQMDKVWNADNTKVTIAFTAEKVRKKWLAN